MADNNNLKVTISAVDRTSAAIDAVAKRLSGLTAPAQRVVHSFAKLSDASGLTRLSKAVAHLGGTAAHAGLRMTEALAPLSGVTAALSLGGLAKITSDWAQFSRGLGFDARRVGSSVSDLQALQGAAQLSGTSAEAAGNGIRNLQDVMTDAADGRNMQALVYFRQLNVAFEDGRGNALRATQVLPQLFDALSRIKDPSRQARVAMEFFGGATEAMLPFIQRGSKGLAEYTALARHYGVETTETTGKAREFGEAQTRLTLAFQGLGRSISEQVSPPLSKMMTYLAELVNKWRPQISQTFGEWAKKAGEWVKSIDWPKVISNIEEMAKKFKGWVDNITNYNPPDWLKWLMRQFSSDPPTPDDGSAPGSGAKSGDAGSSEPPAIPKPDGVESSAPPLTSQTHGDLGRLMMKRLEVSGWSHDDAAAIIAGLDRESGLHADAEGDLDKKTGIKLAYGAAQWHPARQAQFNAWSKAGGTTDGHDIRHSTLEEQLRFIDWDLTSGAYKATGLRMRAAKTLEEKVDIFDREYEAPADKEGAIRYDIPRARQWQGAPQFKGGNEPLNSSTHELLDRMRRDMDPRRQQEPQSLSQAGTNGSIKVDVSIRGLPPGASAVATSSGDATGGVRIARAMA